MQARHARARARERASERSLDSACRSWAKKHQRDPRREISRFPYVFLRISLLMRRYCVACTVCEYQKLLIHSMLLRVCCVYARAGDHCVRSQVSNSQLNLSIKQSAPRSVRYSHRVNLRSPRKKRLASSYHMTFYYTIS